MRRSKFLRRFSTHIVALVFGCAQSTLADETVFDQILYSPDPRAGDAFGAAIAVWEDIDQLHQYVYRSAHNQVLARRKEWFAHIQEAYSVLWWVPAGHIPTIEEAGERLERLRRDGPTAKAFTFKQRFSPD